MALKTACFPLLTSAQTSQSLRLPSSTLSPVRARSLSSAIRIRMAKRKLLCPNSNSMLSQIFAFSKTRSRTYRKRCISELAPPELRIRLNGRIIHNILIQDHFLKDFMYCPAGFLELEM